jgi:4-hydroxythreonine-4-phosphate dehydrogenase
MADPILAITLGDPAGIGPEIALKAAASLGPDLRRRGHSLLILGDAATLTETARALDLPLPPMVEEADLARMPRAGILPTRDDGPAFRPGELSAEAGDQAYRAVATATRLAMEGRVAALVTGPLNKEALNLAGHAYAGHTEMLADLTGVRDSAMMLAHGDFRVSHVSTHCALEEVPRKATRERIHRVIDLTAETLRHLGIARPRIAVAALNPHAGEGGIFGRHDIDVTEPLVQDLRRKGLDVTGPVPGDTVFVKMRGGAFDAVIAMYHDQGHIPVKLLGFSVDRESGRWTGLSGVNVTLGLPIIRTSVDHGTAFDIAGQGIAEATSLIEAIDYALSLARPEVAERAAS